VWRRHERHDRFGPSLSSHVRCQTPSGRDDTNDVPA
jgi:hypothetical protein